MFIGLAIITKGPVALLVFILSALVFWILNRKTVRLKWQNILLFGIACFFVSAIWFGYETYKNGFWFIKEFITYQIRLFQTEDAGHGGPFFYHWIVLLIGCFPASIFFMGALKQMGNLTEEQKKWLQWNIILFFVHLILFSIVKTKIVHYSSLCYLPLSFLAAYHLYKIHSGELSIHTWQKWVFGVVGIFLAIAFRHYLI
jgi:4-amino-4-deoxy-L-arabinose transferase-like glycosyltransferase